MTTVQYRVVVAKGDERVEGPADADVTMTVPHSEATVEGFDPAVAYMQGTLKAAGHTGVLFDLFKSGAAAEAISRLASDP